MGEGDVQIVIAIDDDRLGRTPLLVIDPATVIDIGEPKTLSGWSGQPMNRPKVVSRGRGAQAKMLSRVSQSEFR